MNIVFCLQVSWRMMKKPILLLMMVVEMLVGMNVNRIFVSVRMDMNKIV